ncbi:MAG: sulfur carrier protein ThiS [Planctomycetes bacterium]|nr:sulfur carrier protein ThiS [Planctomycetota bacterium]
MTKPPVLLRLVVNGAPRELAAPDGVLTVAALVAEVGLAGRRVAVEVNGDVVPRADHGARRLADGDRVEVVTFVGGGEVADEDVLRLGDHVFHSRLFVGTGKYATNAQMVAALEASGTECVTVALRRVDFDRKAGPNVLDALGDRWTLLPNTAGCYTAGDAVRVCRLARELALSDLVKLEVLADPETLLPEPFETLKALKTLVAEGFHVLVYTNDDPVTARRLEEAGATAVMPLGSPIGSGLGIVNPGNVERILSRAKVPVIVDAGVGTASDVAIAMELGIAGVLLNTGIAKAKDPVRMARAMRAACVAGRDAFLAGRMPKGAPSASSPTAGTIVPGRA